MDSLAGASGSSPTQQQAKTSIEIPQTLYTVSWKLVSLTSRLTLTQDTQACNQPPQTMFSDTTWPSGGHGGSPRHRTFYGSTESHLMTKPCQPVARAWQTTRLEVSDWKQAMPTRRSTAVSPQKRRTHPAHRRSTQRTYSSGDLKRMCWHIESLLLLKNTSFF